MRKKNQPLSPFEFVLINVILAIIVLIGLTLVTELMSHSNLPAAPVAAQILPSPTPTATASPTALRMDAPKGAPTGASATPNFPPTWTPTTTWTPTPTPTDTPTPTETPSATSKPPLPGLRPTVTPALDIVIINYSATFTETVRPTPVPLIDLPPNTINIELLGSDRRPNDPSWRTDTIIVASINPDIPSVNLFSIPRDTWVYIPNWRYTRINVADEYGESENFPGGGPGLLAETLQYNFGIPIQYYARADFNGFKRLVDSVDGIDVVADCPLYDIFPDNPPNVTDIGFTAITGTIDIPVAGMYHLDGKHALWYARSRKTTSDFDRSRRQQRVLRSLWDKIQARGIIGELPNLWGELNNTVQTNLNLNDVLYLANLGTQIDHARVKSGFLDGQNAHRFTSLEGASVFYFNWDEISGTVQSAFTPPITFKAGQPAASIEVLNGTTHPDWDSVGADRLAWAGYEVMKYGVADRSDYPTTFIYDYRATTKGSRLNELGRLFNVPQQNLISQPDPNAGVEYRIILGNDWDPCQRASLGSFSPSAPKPTPTP